MRFISTTGIERALFFLFFILLFVKSNITFAQSNSEIDSLLIELQTAKADTNQVKTLLALSNAYLNSDQLTEARSNAEEALQLAGKLNFQTGRALAYRHIAMNFQRQKNYPEAIKNFLAGIEISEEIGYKLAAARSYADLVNIYMWDQPNYDDALKSSLASLRLYEEAGVGELFLAPIHNLIANAYFVQGNYTEALKYYLSALEIAKKNDVKEGMNAVYQNIGDVYMSQGIYSEALKHYLTSIELAEELGDKRSVSYVYSSIGRVHKAQGNYPEALKNFQEAFMIAKGIDSIYALTGIAANEIGALYNLMGKYDEVIDHFLKVLKIHVDDKFVISESHSNLGIAYQSKGNYSEALNHYMSAMQIAEVLGNKRQIANTYNNLGIIYTLLDNDTEAQQYLDKGLAVSKEIGHNEGVKNAYLGLSKLDSLRGNYQTALLHYKLYHDTKDILINETNNKEIAQLKEQFESEKKDKEILLLTNEKQQLENEKKISSLLLKNIQSEKEKAQLENEKFFTLNLFNQQQLQLLSNKQQLQELQSEKDKADLAFQKAESDKKQEQLNLLNREKDLRDLELKKEKLTKNYFIAGLGLFLVLSFFIYRNYQSRQEVKLLTLRNKIASDLHDDVGSTLSSIAMFSQIAQTQSKEVIPALETIEDSSKKMLDAMADIVWTINPENDQFEKIIMRMRSFAFELLGARDIDFEFDTDEDVSRLKLSMEARKNLYLIFKEATNNMVKYSQASRAKFAIKGEKDRLTMVIKDNGKGFDTTKESLGNGLKNMKKRAAEIGAQILIDSAPGIGTMIKLELAV